MEDRSLSRAPLLRRAFSINTALAECVASSLTGSSRLSDSANRFSSSSSSTFTTTSLRQDDEWAAREWLRESYRANEIAVDKPPV